MLSHKHIIYDSYDSVYCLTCLDLRSFISFLQGPAHKLRKRRMHRMHRMHWICKRFWSRSPNISKPHPHPPGTSYAATQLCSYAAAAWAWDPNHHKFISRRSQKHARLHRHLTERTELLKELVRFLLRFLLSFFSFRFSFVPSFPSISLPIFAWSARIFRRVGVRTLKRLSSFCNAQKKSGRNSRKPKIGVVTCIRVLWHQKRVLISLVSKSVPKCARKSFDVSQFPVAAKSLILLTGARMDRKNMNPSSIP